MRAPGAAFAITLAASCGGGSVTRDEAPRDVARRYLHEGAYRRGALEASLTTRDNDYARLRLARYERDWSSLPEWNPATEPLRASNLGVPPGALEPLAISDAARSGDLEALYALGNIAFVRYPTMLVSHGAEAILRDRSGVERSGLRLASEGALGGDLVRVALADGSVGLGYTCAACHSATRPDGTVVAGLANVRIDLGALGADADATLDPAVVRRLRAWGPGRVDVSSDDGSEPVAMPDLRTVRFQRYLHRAGAVRLRSLASLAVRVETLLITSHHEAVRPPREVALGLALYLNSLGEALEREAPTGTGARVFAARCAGCHSSPGYAGGLVDVRVVGTDGSIASSITRGTGAYRVPSLRGVAQRERLMHDGSVAGLDALLDARRAGGHTFGLDLGASDRDALRAFLGEL